METFCQIESSVYRELLWSKWSREYIKAGWLNCPFPQLLSTSPTRSGCPLSFSMEPRGLAPSVPKRVLGYSQEHTLNRPESWACPDRCGFNPFLLLFSVSGQKDQRGKPAAVEEFFHFYFLLSPLSSKLNVSILSGRSLLRVVYGHPQILPPILGKLRFLCAR